MDPLKPAAHHVRRKGQRGRQGHKCRELRTFVFSDLTGRNTGVVQTAAWAGMTRQSERKWALG